MEQTIAAPTDHGIHELPTVLCPKDNTPMRAADVTVATGEIVHLTYVCPVEGCAAQFGLVAGA